MEGVCIYLNNYNEPILLMYKEWNPSTIYYGIYGNNKLKTGYMESKLFTEYIPRESEHILTKLPLDKNSEQNTLNMWRSLIKYKLIMINSRDKFKI